MEKFKALLSKFTGWLTPDRAQRIAAAALILVALGWIRPFWIPIIATAAICIAKSIFRKSTNNTSGSKWSPLLPDLIGIAVGCLLVLLNTLA